MQSLGVQQKQQLREIGISDLPIAEPVLLECLDILSSPHSTDTLSGVIRKDPVLYLRSLALLNREGSMAATDLHDAESKADLPANNPIHRLIKSTAVEHYFAERDNRHEALLERYRNESRQCALLSEALAKAAHYPYPHEAYLTGLLHNLGQLVRLVRHSSDYAEMYANASSNIELEMFEKEWFGASSVEIAACLTEGLLLDSFLPEAILFQYENNQALKSAPTLVRVVALASRWVGADADLPQLYQDAHQLLAIAGADCEKIDEHVRHQLVIDHRGVDLVGQQDKHRQSTQASLKAACQQLATQQSLAPLATVKEQELWNALIDNFHLVFSLPTVAVFKYHQGKYVAQAISSNVSSKLLQISLDPTAIEGSSFHQALQQRKEVLKSASASSLNIIDMQLNRYLDSQHLLVIPLVEQQQVKAMLVAGLNSLPDSGEFETQNLSIFKENASQVLQLIHRTSELSQDRFEHFKEHQTEHIRKLVHETANPLGVINNYVEVLKHSATLDPKTHAQLDTIRKEINRISRLLQKIRSVDTSMDSKPEKVDLNRIIRSQIDLLDASLFSTHNIRCDLMLEHGLAELKLPIEGVKQVLLNLLKNAVEAIENSGRILVQTQSGINLNGRLYTQLTISDNGPGIDPSVMAAAFTPVATTKGDGHSGLGLTIVNQLVQEMNGLISCQNLPDQGAEFRILFPAEQ